MSKQEELGSVCFVFVGIGCPVQDSAGSRPLGEHPGSQHRLRPAHWSF